MAQKLIKINTDRYVVVDDSEIKDGDHYINIEPGNPFFGKIYKGMNRILKEGYSGNGYKNPDYFKTWMKKITHSTQPLEIIKGIGENSSINYYYGTDQLSLQEVKELIGEVDVEKKALAFAEAESYGKLNGDLWKGFLFGYNQALENNKEKKYTEEDVIRIVEKSRETGLTAEYLMMTLQPKTEWKVCFVDGKLKLV